MAGRPTRRVVLAAAAVAALAAPASASAAEQVVAGPAPTTYANPNVQIDAGETLSFMNLDITAPHDVTSTEVGPGAQPLFRSETVDAPTTVPVVGAETLGAGSYPFICSIHTFMEGTLTVTGAGGGGGGGPSLKLSAKDRKAGKVLRAGEVRVKAKVNEAVDLRLKVTIAGEDAKLAGAKTELDPGGNKVAAKLTKRGKRALDGSDPLKLEISGRAKDADGNTDRARTRIKLR